MAKIKGDKTTSRKLQSSTITTIVSITLVLFLMGVMGLLILNAKKLSTYVKENIGFTVVLKDDVREVEIKKIQKFLNAKDFVKSTEFVTKDEAEEDLRSELGEDFVAFLGYNPLPSTIEVRFKAQYANPDSIATIEQNALNHPMIKDVWYEKNLIQFVNQNIFKISVLILAFSALLLIISSALINNTIRLSVYSKRFLIKTMQMVGATRGFIRKPFIYTSMLHGFIGAMCAISMLITLVYFIQKEMRGVISLKDVDVLAILFLTVILLGVFINVISTFFATSKYLKMNQDSLYYI